MNLPRSAGSAARFTADVQIKVVTAVGNVGGLTNTITAACQRSCTASGFVSGPTYVPGASFQGTLKFDDGVARNAANTNQVVFTATPAMPDGGLSSPGVGVSSTTVRCDDMFSTQQRAGCVLNAFTPTLTTMAQLPHIAAHIGHIQARGGYGVPGDNARALHRLADPAQQRRNYEVVCGRSVVGPPPKPGLSCDEYPFKTAKEGGTTLPAMYRGTDWVPVSEQNWQGGLISGFYRGNRVIKDDPFWVQV